MNFRSIGSGQSQASAGDQPVQAEPKTRQNLTYLLVIGWLIIVLGKAFGLIDPAIETDALLIGGVGAAFGYIYGKNVVITEQVKAAAAGSRSAGTSQGQDVPQ